jgi:trigger factor
MKVHVETLSPIERKLSIEVEPAQVAAELGRAYTALGQRVRLPGFRPGKVPRRILEQRFRGEVEDDVARRLVEKSYLSAIAEHGVEAVGEPQVTGARLVLDAPFAFEATVEVRPEVAPKDYQGLLLKRLTPSVEEAQVEARIEQLRQRLGRLEPVESRTVAELGDFAVVDYQGSVDGKPFEGGSGEGVTVEVAKGEVTSGNVEALVGLALGETREALSQFPPGHPQAGRTASFRFTLRGLKTRVVPPLDDELAREVGGGPTLEALRTRVRTDLIASAKAEAARTEREQLVKGLIDRNPFPLPKAMVERGLEAMLDGALRSLARGGVDPRELNLDFDALRAEMRPRAEGEVRGALLLEAIAEKEGLKVEPTEVDARIEALAKESEQAVSQVRKAFKDANQRRSLELRIREEKTVEFLRSRAKDESNP